MKLSSRNLITLLLAVPASGLDMSSSTEKFRKALKQISNNSNLSVSSNVRGARQMKGKGASPFEKFMTCGEASDEIGVEDFNGMDDESMEKYMMDGTCTMDMGADTLHITCDLAKAGNKDYTKYAKDCKKKNGKLVTFSIDMCMSGDNMGLDSNRRKLQESSESMVMGEMKMSYKNFPLCVAKQCNDESLVIMEGIMSTAFDALGMTCAEENPKAKFMFKKKKKKNKVKKMTCGALAKKKPRVINKVCFSEKHQDYSGGAKALPASQVCKKTCKPNMFTKVDEVPKAKFSVMEGKKEKIMTCGELKKKTMTKDMKSGMEAQWACIQGFKDDAPKKGGKKALKKIYGGAHKVCSETCSMITGGAMEMLGEESGDD
jgi:hypothetical protein